MPEITQPPFPQVTAASAAAVLGGKCISAADAAQLLGMRTKNFYNSYKAMGYLPSAVAGRCGSASVPSCTG